MKYLVIFSCIIIVTGCSYNKLDDQFVDCDLSNLSIESTSTASDCSVDNGTITMAAQGGEEPYIFKVNNITQNNGEFINIPPGNYITTVTDKNGCFVEVVTLVTNKTGFMATAAAGPAGCKTSEGILLVTPEDGVEPYTYQIPGESPQSSNLFSGLISGNHQVLVTDAQECTFEIIVYVPTGVSYNDLVSPIIMNSCAVTGCHNGTTSLPDFRSLSNVQSFATQVKSRTQTLNMPQVGSLTQAEIDLIACWVDDGALDN